MKKILLFGLMLAGTSATAQATLSDVLADTITRTGWVRTKKGNPLKGVRIQSGGGGPVFWTDEKGRFEIKMPHAYLQYAVWFHKRRFRARLIPLVSIEPEVWMFYQEKVDYVTNVTID